MHEFDLIGSLFAPLSEGFAGSLKLKDDAALIDVPPHQQLVATKDAMTRGVHFLGDEDAALIAKKLLRVNLSDLAAMGAQPMAYLLAVMLPKTTEEAWIKRFAQGLAEDQALFGVSLIGGDTVATQESLSFSITAFGLVEKDTALKRSGARVGDAVYVSGTLGDSALGLSCLRGELASDAFLEKRYLLPQPRVELGLRLQGIATSAMDVSDGLMQDMGHICRASGLGARIDRARLPVSQPAHALLAADAKHWQAVVSGGDDYELLFTAPAQAGEALAQLAAELGLRITAIGEVIEGESAQLVDESGATLDVPSGYSHF
jgi:thiamine-monophosphate kinase